MHNFLVIFQKSVLAFLSYLTQDMSQNKTPHTPSHVASQPVRATSPSERSIQSQSRNVPQLPNFQSPTHGTNIQPTETSEPIWAGALNVNPQQMIGEFLNLFENHYLQTIDYQVLDRGLQFLTLDLFGPGMTATLRMKIQQQPDVVQAFGNYALQQVAQNFFNDKLVKEAEPALQDQFRVAISISSKLYIQLINPTQEAKIALRNASPVLIDQLIEITGLITRKSLRIPDLSVATFVCPECQNQARQASAKGIVQKPRCCPRCRCEDVRLDYSLSQFESKCLLKLQESPDQIRSGETPASANLLAFADVVEGIQAGDRVKVCCIYRVRPERMNGVNSMLRGQFKQYLEVLSVQKLQEEGIVVIQQHDQQIFETTRQLPDELEKIRPKTDSLTDESFKLLINSFAPSIFGSDYDDIKMSLLLQSVGGVKKTIESSNQNQQSQTIYRGDIHILLIGDPGKAKSQLLKFQTQVIPRSIYTSGKGSSAAGLTVGVARGEGGSIELQPGALVLASGGLCALDEFDKLDDTVRVALHECMEGQQISIAKAGVVCSLNAETSILAAANPVDSKYNIHKSVLQNINMEASLISRFDLIFLILDDQQNAKANEELATHLLKLYVSEDAEAINRSLIPQELISRYIALARSLKPKITQVAAQALETAYLELRKQSYNSNKISAMPRQLLSLIRIAEARAKLRFALEVSENDVRAAYNILKTALKMSATNELGLIDVNLVSVDPGTKNYQQIESLANRIMESIDKGPETGVTLLDISQAVGAKLEEIQASVDLLINEGRARRVRDKLVKI